MPNQTATHRKRRRPDMLFPMYVVQVRNFLKMRKAEPHQKLKKQGIVVNYLKSFESVAVFVSHQWCGRYHADPHFRQLGVLQKVFRAAMEGNLSVEVDILSKVYFSTKASMTSSEFRGVHEWWMWYDFFSVPQPGAPVAESTQHTDLQADLGKAVASLAAYVASCKMFMVLAPSIMHDEGFLISYTTWRSRGWCRFERLARALSSRDHLPMLLVDTADTAFEIGAVEWLFDPVGEGCFTVESDKDRIGLTAKKLVQDKLQDLLDEEKYTDYRRLLALRTELFRGLPVKARDVLPASFERRASKTPNLEHFLKMYRFDGPLQYIGGTSPLLLAACAGEVGIVQELLAVRGSVKHKEKVKDPAHLIFTGTRPLHHAAWHGHQEMAILLLDHGADVNKCDVKGLSPLHCATFRGQPEMVRLLVHRQANIDARDWISVTPLFTAVLRSNADILQTLLTNRASPESNPDGLSGLHVAAVFGASPEIVEGLVRAEVPVDGRFRPRRFGMLWTIYGFLDLCYNLGGGGFMKTLGHNIWGATPLMFAVMCGQHVVVAELVDGGADVTLQNDQGLTAAQLGVTFQHDEELRTQRTAS